MGLKHLNEKYAIPGQIEFVKGKGNLPVVLINNSHAKAEISLYGAQVLSFIPLGKNDVLWLSQQSIFEAGKPIRGGIPVCFPWFGPHETDKQKPMHGFARLFTWDVLETIALENGNTKLVMGLTSNAETYAYWPFAFFAKMIFEVGDKLEVTLSCTNIDCKPFIISEALHSYFSISHISNIAISGLKDCYYYAGFAKEANNRQVEDTLKISGEENRRYINHADDCVIIDPKWDRKIRIAKKGSMVTVVWNPFSETVKTMADIPDSAYQDFICVEAVNSYEFAINVNPGESHCVSTILSLQ